MMPMSASSRSVRLTLPLLEPVSSANVSSDGLHWPVVMLKWNESANSTLVCAPVRRGKLAMSHSCTTRSLEPVDMKAKSLSVGDLRGLAFDARRGLYAGPWCEASACSRRSDLG